MLDQKNNSVYTGIPKSASEIYFDGLMKIGLERVKNYAKNPDDSDRAILNSGSIRELYKCLYSLLVSKKVISKLENLEKEEKDAIKKEVFSMVKKYRADNPLSVSEMVDVSKTLHVLNYLIDNFN